MENPLRGLRGCSAKLRLRGHPANHVLSPRLWVIPLYQGSLTTAKLFHYFWFEFFLVQEELKKDFLSLHDHYHHLQRRKSYLYNQKVFFCRSMCYNRFGRYNKAFASPCRFSLFPAWNLRGSLWSRLWNWTKLLSHQILFVPRLWKPKNLLQYFYRIANLRQVQ